MSTLQRIIELAQAELDLPAELAATGQWPTDRPLKELGIDSLSFMEFVFRLEDAFGVSIPEEVLKPEMDLTQFAALIDQLKAGAVQTGSPG